MNDKQKTKAQLIAELQKLRQQVAQVPSPAGADFGQALRRSEVLNRTILEAGPGGIIQVSAEGAIIRTNAEAQRIFGLSSGSLAHRFITDFKGQTIWEDGTPCNVEDYPVTRCLQTNLPQPPVTIGLRREDGTISWAIYAAVPLPDSETGQIVGAVITLFDITERKNIEQREKLAYELGQQLTSLLDSEMLLRKTVYHLQETFGYYHVQVYLLEPDPVFSKQKTELKGDLLILREGTGPAARELIRRQHSIPLNAKRSLVARAARLRMPVVANDVSRNPSHLPNPLLPETRAEVAVPLLVEQRLLGVLDAQHSITNYFNVDKIRILQIVANQLSIALTNAQLFTENERRLAIIENSAELIALANLEDGLVIYVNPGGARLAGYSSSEEVVGKNIADFYALEDIERMKKEILPIVFDQGVWWGENHLRRTDGTLVPIAQTIFTIPDKYGQPQTMATIISDITERKRAEVERATMQTMMFQSGKLASVGELASGVAHEINNPIYAIREFADLILEDTSPDDPNYSKLQTIIRSADRIADIVRNLLAFARPAETHFSPTHIEDVWRITDNLVGQSFLKHNIQLQVDIPAGLPKIRARTQQLQQVLLNLVTNARDALNEKYPGYHPNKRISVKACLAEDPTFPALLNKDQDRKQQVIHLMVRDEGVGITPEHRERLFTPFFTTKRPNRGTGLGLSISHKIIEDHQGRIEVESEPGVFTEITVILPIDNGGSSNNQAS